MVNADKISSVLIGTTSQSKKIITPNDGSKAKGTRYASLGLRLKNGDKDTGTESRNQPGSKTLGLILVCSRCHLTVPWAQKSTYHFNKEKISDLCRYVLEPQNEFVRKGGAKASSKDISSLISSFCGNL